MRRVTGADQPPADGDGAVAGRGGPRVAVVTADCVPLLIASGDGIVAAVHAGWRGLAAGVVERAVERLRESGASGALAAALGPAAGGCCYEIGAEVIGRLRGARGLGPADAGRAMFDLRAAVVERLERAGLERAAIERVGPCTICSSAWPSYRREGARAGRLTAWIGPAAPG